MKYDLDYFIAKVEAIPEDQWTVGKYADNEGRCCAMGHLGVRELSRKDDSEVARGRDTAESKALCKYAYDITIINDGINDLANYAPTPKQRVLKHLRALKHLSERDADLTSEAKETKDA